MIKGTIKLIWRGVCIKRAEYECIRSRERILDRWRRLYQEDYEKMAVQIRPDVNKKFL